jgi:hypothetical protein
VEDNNGEDTEDSFFGLKAVMSKGKKKRRYVSESSDEESDEEGKPEPEAKKEPIGNGT